MGLLKFLVVGAAVAAGVNYATRKRPDGKSLIDDVSEKAPEWMDKAKQVGNQVKDQISQRLQTSGKQPSGIETEENIYHS